MRAALTDAFIRGVKAPASGRSEIADLRCAGLSFRVTAAGHRSWSFRFRDPVSGRTSRARLGDYPALTLAAARARTEDMRRTVADGVNPNQARRDEREGAPARTFGAVAERYMREHARRKKRPRSADEDQGNLDRHILPKWRNRPIDSIRRRDVIELIEAKIADGHPTAANRLHSLVSVIFSFAVECQILESNPCARLKKRGVEKPGRRVLSDAELRLFWDRIVFPPVSRRVGLCLRLQLLTGCRGGEIAGLTRAEIVGLDDPQAAAFTIPADRMKGKRAHYVPLSSLAVETLHSALELSPPDCEFVFPSRHRDDAPITSHALAVAMRRFAGQVKGDREAVKTWRNDPAGIPSSHDLRRTLRTRLSVLGVPRDTCDAIMAHVPGDIGRKVYDLHDKAKEKRDALCRWSLVLQAIVDPKPATVIPITKGRRGRRR